MPRCLLMMTALLLSVCPAMPAAFADAAEFPTFRERVIDPHCGKVCYAVTTADVNGDKKLDIVAVTENRVLWYENPSWTKHVIIEDQTIRDNVCIAPQDIDGDGQIDFALGAGWTKIGTIQWLTRGKSLDDTWTVHPIDRERWLHRMRFADVLGKGRPQLVISPLNATVGKGVRLTAFEIPENPQTGRWTRHVLDASLNRMHNHWHTDFDGDGTTDTLTASREGIHLLRKTTDGFSKTKIGTGAQGDKPNARGAGEIKTGKLKSGETFFTTVEPMHGTMLVVYTSPKQRATTLWQRHVLTSDLVRGHALWVADLDRDGADEIVIGHSNTKPGENIPRGLYVFDSLNSAGTKWKKHVLDEGGIAVEDARTADVNGDGYPDVVAGGRYTHNIKLYVNQGR